IGFWFSVNAFRPESRPPLPRSRFGTAHPSQESRLMPAPSGYSYLHCTPLGHASLLPQRTPAGLSVSHTPEIFLSLQSSATPRNTAVGDGIVSAGSGGFGSFGCALSTTAPASSLSVTTSCMKVALAAFTTEMPRAPENRITLPSVVTVFSGPVCSGTPTRSPFCELPGRFSWTTLRTATTLPPAVAWMPPSLLSWTQLSTIWTCPSVVTLTPLSAAPVISE